MGEAAIRELEPVTVDPATGLTAAEVEARRHAGLVNKVPKPPSRTVTQIIRTNLLTRFNALMCALGAIVLVLGHYRDALFLGVVVSNTLIGVIQELRAKQTLDGLSVLTAPHMSVIRDGQVSEVDIDDIVVDDVVELTIGQQIPADGEVLATDGLEVDESLLTGESDPVVKHIGDDLKSGSFVVAGSGRATMTGIGADAYAAKLAEEARRFTMVRSELRDSIDSIVTAVTWLLVPVGLLLFVRQVNVAGVSEGLVRAVGGVVAMVPEGLVLVTSVAFAVGVVRLARRGTLVQELPAIEVLARVNVICLDKTGTLTDGTMSLDRIEPIEGANEDEVRTALAALAWTDPAPNATQLGIRQALADNPGWTVETTVPFSSARKWSGAQFDEGGAWVMGAPEMLLGDRSPAEVNKLAAQGLRVLVLARVDGDLDESVTADRLHAAALITLEDHVRPDAPETLGFFAEQNVELKVISGDNPVTVGAVARRAGLADAASTCDARQLLSDDVDLADELENASVFGRVGPHQKQDMVKALQSRGRVVAMTGDGVNDVLALKESDCGIAMASGSEATRAVAQLVLLNSTFSSLPSVVAEGRRVINNIERVASLFLVKTTYATLIALSVAIAGIPYPFLPRQLTLIGSITIGVPAFFLAMAQNQDAMRPGFMHRVLRFAVPGGVAATVATLTGFTIARGRLGLITQQQQTVATIIVTGVALVMLVRIARPLVAWKLALVAAMIAFEALVVITPFGRDFFQLQLPDGRMMWACMVLIAAAAGLLPALTALFDVVADRWMRRADRATDSADPAAGEGPDEAR